MLQKPLSSNDNKWPGTWTIYLFMRIRWLVWPYTEHYQHTCTYTYTQTHLVGSREANKVVFMTIRWLRPLILSRGDTRPIEGHPAFMPCLDNQPSSQAEQMQYTQGHKRGAPAKLCNIKDIQGVFVITDDGEDFFPQISFSYFCMTSRNVIADTIWF